LVSVNTSVVGVPSAIDASPHDLVSVGASTVNVRLTAVPVKATVPPAAVAVGAVVE
jgi:hypothetical protein